MPDFGLADGDDTLSDGDSDMLTDRLAAISRLGDVAEVAECTADCSQCEVGRAADDDVRAGQPVLAAVGAVKNRDAVNHSGSTEVHLPPRILCIGMRA